MLPREKGAVHTYMYAARGCCALLCVAVREIVAPCISMVAFTHRAAHRSNAQRMCERPMFIFTAYMDVIFNRKITVFASHVAISIPELRISLPRIVITGNFVRTVETAPVCVTNP